MVCGGKLMNDAKIEMMAPPKDLPKAAMIANPAGRLREFCKKCGDNDILTRFIHAGKHITSSSLVKVEDDFISSSQHDSGYTLKAKKEHLTRHCRNCQYEWRENTQVENIVMSFIRHIVTKASNDGTFQVGDHIIFEADGSISCIEAKGWIDKDDVPSAIIGMESQPDRDWLQKRKEKLRDLLNILEA
jgi:hypothetical protein